MFVGAHNLKKETR